MIEIRPDSLLFVRPFLAVTAGILVLFVGKTLNRRFGVFREFNIPEPVTGGLLVAVTLWLVYAVSGWRIAFDMAARDVLLVYFFAVLGINARIGELLRGGRPLVIMLTGVVIFMLLQNTAGVLLAVLVGRPPELGLLVGSVSLLGGHGTAIGWAPAFVERGISGALEIGVLCATAGLVLGSIAAGPVARYLVQRYQLQPEPDDRQDVGVRYDQPAPTIDYFSFLHGWLGIHVTVIAGVLLQSALTAVGLMLPLFVPVLLGALVISNAMPRLLPGVAWPSRTPALALIAEVSLGVFLAMSLMSMELWTLAVLAGPLLLMLLVQGALLVAFAVFVLWLKIQQTTKK